MHGKITQTKVANVSGKSTVTIKRYWDNYKDYTADLNNDFIGTNTKVIVEYLEPKTEDMDISEDELFLLQMKESAMAYADNFVEKMTLKEELQPNEIDYNYLSEILNQANIKYVHKVLIQDEIDSGQISTLEELEERMSY